MIRSLLFVTAILFSCAQLVVAVTKSFEQLTAQADADLQAGNVDAAIQEYNRVIALNLTPQQASIAVMRRGNCYYAKHDLERAIADYDRALRLNPKNPGAYDNRANALDARGDLDNAIRDYNESIRLNPRNSLVFVNRGSLLVEKGDLAGALADYAKTLALNPHEENAHVGRSYVYSIRKEPEKALKEANAAIAIAPGQAVPYIRRANVYMHLGRYADAEADIQRALRLKNFDRTVALSELAWFRATCPDPHFRDGRQALEAAQRRCRSLNFFSFECLDILAAAYAEVGDFDQAVSHQVRAIQTAPSGFPKLSEMKERLELYKKHKPYREWPKDKSKGD